MDEQGYVAAVVDYQFGTFIIRMAEGAVGALPILFQRLALPGKDRDSGHRNGGGGVVLRGEDVAACPADRGTEFDQGLDQYRGLNGHVQRAGDAYALERLRRGILLANGHQSGHFEFGNGYFLAAPLGECKVGNFKIGQYWRELRSQGNILQLNYAAAWIRRDERGEIPNTFSAPSEATDNTSIIAFLRGIG